MRGRHAGAVEGAVTAIGSRCTREDLDARCGDINRGDTIAGKGSQAPAAIDCCNRDDIRNVVARRVTWGEIVV